MSEAIEPIVGDLVQLKGQKQKLTVISMFQINNEKSKVTVGYFNDGIYNVITDLPVDALEWTDEEEDSFGYDEDKILKEIFNQTQFDLTDTQETLEDRLNNIRDYYKDLTEK